MASVLSLPHCVFVFVFDGLYLYLCLIRILYLYLYLKLEKNVYLYLYLMKRIWPQPWCQATNHYLGQCGPKPIGHNKLMARHQISRKPSAELMMTKIYNLKSAVRILGKHFFLNVTAFLSSWHIPRRSFNVTQQCHRWQHRSVSKPVWASCQRANPHDLLQCGLAVTKVLLSILECHTSGNALGHNPQYELTWKITHKIASPHIQTCHFYTMLEISELCVQLGSPARCVCSVSSLDPQHAACALCPAWITSMLRMLCVQLGSPARCVCSVSSLDHQHAAYALCPAWITSMLRMLCVQLGSPARCICSVSSLDHQHAAYALTGKKWPFLPETQACTRFLKPNFCNVTELLSLQIRKTHLIET